MLSNAHTITDDDSIGLAVNTSRFFKLPSRKPRMFFDFGPRDLTQIVPSRFESRRMTFDEVDVEYTRLVHLQGTVISFDNGLHNSLDRRYVPTNLNLIIV